MSNEKNNSPTLYIVIIIGCLILGGFYYLTEKNKQEMELQLKETEYSKEEEEEKEREAKYNECMETVYDNYVLNWNTACESRSLPEECQLTVDTSSRLEEEKKRQEDRCFDLYKK